MTKHSIYKFKQKYGKTIYRVLGVLTIVLGALLWWKLLCWGKWLCLHHPMTVAFVLLAVVTVVVSHKLDKWINTKQ